MALDDKKGRANLPLSKKQAVSYLDADAEAAALSFLSSFLAEADAFAEADMAEAEADADAGAAAWLAANEETANNAVARAAIRFFIFQSLE
jgi:hypothetical protein